MMPIFSALGPPLLFRPLLAHLLFILLSGSDEVEGRGNASSQYTDSPLYGVPVESCTVVTAAANALVANLRDRMPVILPPDAYSA
jgi:hypothetical protein